MTTPSAIIRMPSEYETELTDLWKEIRIASAFGPETDLGVAEQCERFDAATLTEWVVPLLDHSSSIVTAILGYLVARRGECEVGEYKFKNMSADDIEKIVRLMKEVASKDQRGN